MAPKAQGRGVRAKKGQGMGGASVSKMLGLLKYQAERGKVQVKTASYDLPSTHYYYYFVLSTIYTLPLSIYFLSSAI